MLSVWQDSVKDRPRRPSQALQEHIRTDVLVIGGGLAGVLCAHALKKAGVPCVLVEAARLGSGMTGHTTGKITAQHGLIYADLMAKSVASARQHYEINTKAKHEIQRLAESIPCGYEEKTAYVYSLHDRPKLEREANAYQKLGIPMEFQEDTALPFGTAGALGMTCQAQFNPMPFLLGLADGLTIYEDTFVTSLEGNTARAPKGSVTARHIILATHFPLVNIPGLYFVKMYQHRSYVIALKNAPNIGGMYVDERPEGFSFRNYNDLLLIGGCDHRTGKTGGCYGELRRLALNAYPQSAEAYHWAAQDCMTLDNRPYIGVHRKNAQNLYVATGFGKWGMTGSMAAAMVLSDLIVNGRSDYEALFSPGRNMLTGQLFLNLAHAVAGLVSFGKRCTHMGCALQWNAVERTWDCSCHGSRFEKDGRLIDNPAKRGKTIG